MTATSHAHPAARLAALWRGVVSARHTPRHKKEATR